MEERGAPHKKKADKKVGVAQGEDKDVLRFGSDRDFKRLSNLLFSHYIGGTESADFYKN